MPVVAGIGNAIMTVPMVRQLGRVHDVTVWCHTKAMGQVFERLPEVKQVLVGMKPNLRAVRRQTFDWCVVPFPSNRWQYTLLARLSGAKRIAMHSYPVGTFSALHFAVPGRLPAQQGLHDVVQNLRLLTLLDLTPDETDTPTFITTGEDATHADALLSGRRDYIVLHAGSANTVLAQAKRWPPQRFAAIAEKLLERGETVVLVEGPDEAGVTEEICRHATADLPVVKLAGHLGTAAEVLRRAKLYVGSDSGLAHLAAAVGTPPVTLFGPADPQRVCPHGYAHLVLTPGRATFLYPWRATRPRLPRGDASHVHHLTAEQVWGKVEEALEVI